MRQGGEPQGVQVVRQGEPTPYHCNFNRLYLDTARVRNKAETDRHNTVSRGADTRRPRVFRQPESPRPNPAHKPPAFGYNRARFRPPVARFQAAPSETGSLKRHTDPFRLPQQTETFAKFPSLAHFFATRFSNA